MDRVVDPLKLKDMLWPDVTFSREQKEIIYSVQDNDETVVPAGNMLGKDFVTGFIILWFFLSRHPCRVVTTSADFGQLRGVLWGEIRRFIQSSRQPLDSERGGPLVVNDLRIRKVVNGQICGVSYVEGRVAKKGEGMLGHHVTPESGSYDPNDGVPRTLFAADEASGVDDLSYSRALTWASRRLVIGNPFPCNNFFKHAVKGKPDRSDPGGDVPRETATGVRGYHRRVIKIKAEQSPNVRYALAEKAAGEQPSGRVLVPGILPYDKYVERRRLWDPVLQCVGLDAEFYEGAEVLLFPPQWLNRAERVADLLRGMPRRAESVGVDPGEGGANTVTTVGDRYGIIERVGKRTPDTSVIVGDIIALAGRKHKVPPENWVIDRGGGGKQIADQLRLQGYGVRTVPFGESLVNDPRRLPAGVDERVDVREDRYAFKNRRAQMYGELRQALDPTLPGPPLPWSPEALRRVAELLPEGATTLNAFGIGREYTAERHQLSPIPLTHDSEGRLYLLPKNKPSPEFKGKTLTDVIGHSPDEADALVLMLHGMLHKPKVATATLE